MSVFVIDLDGTLLSESGILEEQDVYNLIQLQKKGHRIIIASGRTYSEAYFVIRKLELEKYKGAAVLSDGQYVFDYLNDEKYVRERLKLEDIQKIIDCVGMFSYPIKVFSEDGVRLVFSKRLSLIFAKYYIAGLLRRSTNHLIDVKHLDRISDADKIAVYSSTYLEEISKHYEVSYIKEKQRYEIKQKNVNKASSVKQICGLKTEDVFVFGNDENDICLFKEFPNSYAMYDSTEIVKSFANQIIDNREKGAVVREILRVASIERIPK